MINKVKLAEHLLKKPVNWVQQQSPGHVLICADKEYNLYFYDLSDHIFPEIACNNSEKELESEEEILLSRSLVDGTIYGSGKEDKQKKVYKEMHITICSRNKANKLLRQKFPQELRPNVVSFTDIDKPTPNFRAWNKHQLIGFKFDDEDDPELPGAPTREDVQRLIDWAKGLDSARDLVVHCEAGICRSSAGAMIVFAALFPEEDFFEKFKDRIGVIMPNPLMTSLADEILGLNGKLFNAAEKIANTSLIFKLEE